MSKLTPTIRKRLNEEAREWDAAIHGESSQEVEELLEKAEPFESTRPVRRSVSLRLDPFDIALLKRIARTKGIPYTQLMAMWLHERIEQEKATGSC